MLPPQFEEDGLAVAERSRAAPKKPPLFRVLLHNDDFTTMEFVIHVLQNIFNLTEDAAVEIMLHVHMRGVGVAGIYTYEIAEMKVAATLALARSHEFPLLCTIDEA